MTAIGEKLRIWQERFVLDPELPSGIRWKKLAAYQNKQTMAGHLADGYYRVKTGGKTYGCSHIVLALSGLLPKEGEKTREDLLYKWIHLAFVTGYMYGKPVAEHGSTPAGNPC